MVDGLDIYPVAMEFDMEMDCATGYFWKMNTTDGCKGNS